MTHIGSFILNLMPCVLLILSIKLGSKMKAHARPDGQLRAGFLLSAAGVVSFIWLLAAATILAKILGFRRLGIAVSEPVLFLSR